MNKTEEIKQFIKDRGMSLVGVAPAERFADVTEGRKPDEILPGCRSVIAFGLAMPEGVTAVKREALKSGDKAAEDIYGRYGRGGIAAGKIMCATYAACSYMERKWGVVAMPMMTGAWSFGRPFSLRHAAVAAGLGEFGLNKAVLTPEYGPRVRWGAILTQEALTPDPLYADVPLCAGEACGKCLSACPSHAIHADHMVSVTMDGKRFGYAEVSDGDCAAVCMALKKAYGGKDDYLTAERPTRADVEEAVARVPYGPGTMLRPPSWRCDRCIMACPAGKH